jgi:hypothetical protein
MKKSNEFDKSYKYFNYVHDNKEEPHANRAGHGHRGVGERKDEAEAEEGQCYLGTGGGSLPHHLVLRIRPH